MPTTQRGALQRSLRNDGVRLIRPLSPGAPDQSPHYYEWLFRWRRATVQVFLAAGLA